MCRGSVDHGRGRATGAVGRETYAAFIAAGGGVGRAACIIAAFAFAQACIIGGDLTLAVWCASAGCALPGVHGHFRSIDS